MPSWTDELIADILEECGVDRSAIPNGFRFQVVRGKGFCNCHKCKNSWSSYWIWIKIDLSRAKIIYRFKQKCVKCKNTFLPIILRESLEEMTRIVAKRYNDFKDGIVKPKPKNGIPGRDKKPHESKLCEKCGYGERKCWLPRNQLEE